MNKFQITADKSAQKITVKVTISPFTMPAPIVFATWVPVSAPINSRLAPNITACFGDKTFVETTVAIAFAQSWNPFINSNASAVIITAARTKMLNSIPDTLILL